MTFDEIITSLKAHLYDRIANPLAGAFVISWSVWNYRILLHVFSYETANEKISAIQMLFNDTLVSLWFPIATTLAIIFIYPFVGMPAFWVSRFQKKILKKIRQKFEDEEPVSNEKYRALRENLSRLQIEYDADIERKNEEISSLKNIIEEKGIVTEDKMVSSSEKADQKNIVENEVAKTNLEEQLRILKVLAENYSNSTQVKLLINKADLTDIKGKYHIAEMEMKKWIYQATQSPLSYALSHEGKKVLINHRML